MYGIEWGREGEAFPVGSFVVADRWEYEHKPVPDGTVGRVLWTRGRIVSVRFPGVPDDRAGQNGRTFDADWLRRVIYVRARYYGPGMQPGRSEFHGSRIVVAGTHGDRRQLTAPIDHADRDYWHTAVIRFARERDGMAAPSVELVRERNGIRTYSVTETGRCECSDEYGPCEHHGETIVSREGASLRSADDLCHTFLGDVASVLGSWPSDAFREAETRLGNALHDSGGSWWNDPDDADECRDLVTNGEAALGDAGYSVYWEDGYRIIRITGGPLVAP